MTDKELRRMNRGELLQMLITQVEENKMLQEKLEQTETALKDRQITIEQSGSLAEVALSLNGVFQATDAAAKQYLENIKRMSSQQEGVCRDMQAEAEKKAAATVQEANAYSQKMHSEADQYWRQVEDKARKLSQDLDSLHELLHSVWGNEEK